jgi:flagellar basal-body rod modification protein FlgD
MANIDLSNLNYATVSDGSVLNTDGTARTKQTDSTTSSISSSSGSGTDMGYEQFLTLLCAEMQYQDPLEPTSNTEYVAQLATFSQLEATLSMKDTTSSMEETLQNSLTNTQQIVQTNMANSLVGKYVILAPTDADTGEKVNVSGKVDYVAYDENGGIMLSVNDGLYSIDTLDTIADSDYYEAVALSLTMDNMLGTLPALEDLDSSYATMVGSIRELYDGMTSYQQSQVSTSSLSSLVSYEQKIAELKAAEEEAEQTAEQTAETTEEASEATEV